MCAEGVISVVTINTCASDLCKEYLKVYDVKEVNDGRVNSVGDKAAVSRS